jgi:hypothetical protein
MPVQVRADRNVAAGMPGEADSKYAWRAGSRSALERAARSAMHVLLHPLVLPNHCDRIFVWNFTQPAQRCSRLTVSQCKLPEATRNFYVDGHKPKPH